jgi:hypothetical protein
MKRKTNRTINGNKLKCALNSGVVINLLEINYIFLCYNISQCSRYTVLMKPNRPKQLAIVSRHAGELSFLVMRG